MAAERGLDDSTHKRQLDDLIGRYLQAEEEGRAVSVDEFLSRQPELRDAFLDFLFNHRRSKAAQRPTESFAPPPDPVVGTTMTIVPYKTVVGDCLIQRKLGQGGMGVVYLGQHVRVRDLRAVKILPRDRVTDDAIKRFWQEARAAAQINHRNVVSIHDVGQTGQLHFIVMQYVEGETLTQVLRRHLKRGQGKPVRWPLQYAIPVLDALAAMHSMDLIHRDIKPSNIMVANPLTSDAHVLLMDFGLVQERISDAPAKAGAIMGTPAYMSCEQARGMPLDARTDLYSVGATLYTLLSGRPPYEGSSREIYWMAAEGKPPTPLKELRDDLPDSVCQVIAKAMEADRGKRYVRAEEMLGEIRRVLRELGGRSRRRRRSQSEKSLAQPSGEAGPDDDTDSHGSGEAGVFDSKRDTAPPGDSSTDRFVGMVPLEPVETTRRPVVPTIPSIPSRVQTDATRTDSLWEAGTLFGLSPSSWKIAAVVGMLLFVSAALALLAVGTRPRRQATVPAAPPQRESHQGMVHVSAGKVWIGATEDGIRAFATTVPDLRESPNTLRQIIEQCCELPPRMAHVDAFWIDRYEVTNADYAKFARATGHPVPSAWKGSSPPRGRENHPVRDVSYSDAQAYAKWVGKQLPTEAQWLRAYRGDKDHMFPWGNEYVASNACVYDNMAFPGGTSPVDAASEDRTSFGVVGMAGNVSEIVRDRARRQGALAAMFKGGNNDGAGYIYSLAPMRAYLIGESSHPFVGFRCVLENGR